MAKGGGRRSYVRDGRGRFASTPGGSSGGKKPAKGRSASTGRPQPRTFRQRQQASLDRRPGQGGYLGKATREAKAKLRASKAKLKTNATPQQRAAVTRAAIRAEGASPVTRMRRAAPAGVLKGVKAARAQGRRVKPGKAQAPQPPQKQQGNPLARMATIGRKRVRLTGRLINMNARSPVQFQPPPKNQENPFGTKDQTMVKGIQAGLRWLSAKGFTGGTFKQGKRKYSGQAAARMMTVFGGIKWNRDGGYTPVPPSQQIQLNQISSFWKNPGKRARENRRSGWWSTSSPVGALYHEIGHLRDPKLKQEQGRWAGGLSPWLNNYGPRGDTKKSLASRVSGYAATSPAEFIAETYAGLRTGRKYDREVMAAYREAMGLPAKPPARMRSRLPRRRKPKP